MPRVLKTLYSQDGTQRVLVVERSDGHYSLRVEKRYQNIYEGRLVAEGWRPIPDAQSIFQSADIAEREARLRFPWLS